MKKVSENVYVETGYRGCSVGFVTTSAGIVMIDAPYMPAEAVKWREEIGRHGQVRYLINTEPHVDHIAGDGFFGGTVVAHEGTRAAALAASIAEYTAGVRQVSPESLPLLEGFRFRPADITFTREATLYVGSHTFHLVNLPGHTPFEVAVHIPEEKVLFTSDNVFYKVQAWMVHAVPYQWLESLDELGKFDARVLVPGHGDVCTRDYLPEMKRFIQDWIDLVKGAVDRGLPLEEAQKTLSMAGRYPMEAGTEQMMQMVQEWNVARLYEVLKTGHGS